MKVHYGRILIPHLAYKVDVRPFPRELKGQYVAFVRHPASAHVEICLRPREAPPIVAHEITHALQFIAEDRAIRFDDEKEHFAYLMSYMMCEIFKYKIIERLRANG